MRAPLLLDLPHLVHGFGILGGNDPLREVVTARQVHGDCILEVDEDSPLMLGEADALICGVPGKAVAVRTADCLPILVAHRKKPLVMAVHSGWRGTVLRILEKSIWKMMERGGSLEDLRVVLGPCICGVHYEVGPEVCDRFEASFRNPGSFLTRKNGNQWMLDLQKANEQILVDLGMKKRQMEVMPLCTHERDELFYSYRREKEEAGRMINFIGLTKENT